MIVSSFKDTPAPQAGAIAGGMLWRDATRLKVQKQNSTALAVVHAEFILIHPFREGNGRCGRLLAILMGL
jgi:fido (protein-threonine AMPylation protein)